MKKEISILMLAVSIWCAGFVLAPVLPDQSWIYTFYSAVCHQFDSRSFHIGGESLAVCGRCTGIYSGFLLGLMMVRFSKRTRSNRFSPVFLVCSSVVPMLISQVIELSGLFTVSTLVRSITGLWFGIGLSLLLFGSLTEIIHSLLPKSKKNYEFET